MILIQTPLRISLVGGGSDLPSFYENHPPGGVVSFAIDKYVFMAVNEKFEENIRISYSLTENIDAVDCIKHDLVRTCLERMEINKGIEIVSIGDIPGRGTGLGSSSSFTVGLLNALCQYRIMKGLPLVKDWSGDVAEEACDIEINRCGKTIGKQDQYAAAYGGLNHFSFQKDGSVGIKKMPLEPEFKQAMESHMLLFWTGRHRFASEILVEQSKNIRQDAKKAELLADMASMAGQLYQDLMIGDISKVGYYLHENWQRKKKLASQISDEQIDLWYRSAREAGADGAKICGAGFGGFLFVWAKPEYHDAVKEAVGLRCEPIKIDPKGTRIAFLRGQDE